MIICPHCEREIDIPEIMELKNLILYTPTPDTIEEVLEEHHMPTVFSYRFAFLLGFEYYRDKLTR